LSDLVRLAPYVSCGILVAVELITLRRPRPDAQARDRGTFWVIQIALTLGMTAAFWTWSHHVGFGPRLGSWSAALGLAYAAGAAAC
jgi:hypothetical protein